MDRVTIRIGRFIFDHADYDADADVLYLHIGAPAPSEGEETPEGHVVQYRAGTHEVVGLTIVNAQWLLAREGRLAVTMPEVVEATAADLAAGLAAA